MSCSYVTLLYRKNKKIKKNNRFSVQILFTNTTNSADNLKNKFYNVCVRKVYGFYIILHTPKRLTTTGTDPFTCRRAEDGSFTTSVVIKLVGFFGNLWPSWRPNATKKTKISPASRGIEPVTTLREPKRMFRPRFGCSLYLNKKKKKPLKDIL